MSDETSERRRSGPSVEKWILVTFAGATLAFSFYESTGAYLDSIRTDNEQLMRNQAVFERELEFARIETSALVRRVELVETKCAEIRERIGAKDK